MTETTDKVQKPNEPQMDGVWKRLRAIPKWAVTVVSFVAALITIASFWQIWPRHGLAIAFTDPLPDTVTPELCVFTVRGRGAPPSGQALVVSAQQQSSGDDAAKTLNFAITQGGPDAWHATVQIGHNNTKAGTPYVVAVWQVDADWITYLTQVTLGQRQWWVTLGSPPGAKRIRTVTVTRTAGGKCTSS